VHKWTVGCLTFVSQVAVYAAVETQRFESGPCFSVEGPKRAAPMLLHIQVISEPFSIPVSVTVIAVSGF